MLTSARTLLANTTPRGRLVLGGCVAAVVLLAFFMLRVASAPSYATLMTGLDPAQTGKMTQALDSKGIRYRLENGGTALAVESGQASQARIALAGQGLLTNAQPGFALFDKQKLGASNFQQQVTYQRALEGQIANTLNQIDGVSGAQVSLVLPQDQLFAQDQRPATAAVLLQSTGSALDPAAVRGMAQLVASSVQGLKPSSVTITDSAGQLLWPAGPDSGGDPGAATSKAAAEARYDQGLESSLQAMLDRTLGPGKAQAKVHADLNVDKARSDELVYSGQGVPVTSHRDTETLQGAGNVPGGAAGAAANVPPSYGQTSPANGGNYRHTVADAQLAVNKKVTHTDVAPGAVDKLDVALVVDSSVPPAAVAQLRGAVSSAVGLNPQRRDQLSVAQVPFAKPASSAQPGALGGLLGYAKYLGLGLASAAFLFFLSRHLRRREGEALAEPTWLREISAPTPVAELEGTRRLAMPPVPPPPSPEEESRREVEALVERNPEQIASQVKAWMMED